MALSATLRANTMRIFKTKWVHRWAAKEGLNDASLRGAVDEMLRGLVDADVENRHNENCRDHRTRYQARHDEPGSHAEEDEHHDGDDHDRLQQVADEVAHLVEDGVGLELDHVELDADRVYGLGARNDLAYLVAQIEDIAAFPHRDREAERRLSVIAHARSRRINVATAYRRDVLQAHNVIAHGHVEHHAPDLVDDDVDGPPGRLRLRLGDDQSATSRTDMPRSTDLHMSYSVSAAIDAAVEWSPSAAWRTSCRFAELVASQPRDVFAAMGSTITHVGAQGAGHTVKLVNQILVVVNALAVSEALLFAQAGGLDVEKTLEAVVPGAAGSCPACNPAR